MAPTVCADQSASEPIEPMRERYDIMSILRRDVASLEMALQRQTARAEAAEAELLAIREDNHGMMLEIDVLRKALAAIVLKKHEIEGQLSLAESEMINVKAWSVGYEAKRHIGFAMTAIGCARRALLQSTTQPAVPAPTPFIPDDDTRRNDEAFAAYCANRAVLNGAPGELKEPAVAVPAVPAVPEECYLLERQEGKISWYISATTRCGGAWNWTADVNAAVRFSRAEDAAACWKVIARHHVGVGGSDTTETFPTQHIFEKARALLQSAEVKS